MCVCVHKDICVYRHSTHTHTHAHTNIDNLLLLDVHRDLLDDLLFAAPLLVLDLCVCVCVCVCGCGCDDDFLFAAPLLVLDLHAFGFGSRVRCVGVFTGI